MTTTSIVIIAVVVIVLALVAVMVVRGRRRAAQASERMGLPPLGTVSGDPVGPATTSVDDTTSVTSDSSAKAAKPSTGE